MFEELTRHLPDARTHVFSASGHLPITDVTDELAKVTREFLHT